MAHRWCAFVEPAAQQFRLSERDRRSKVVTDPRLIAKARERMGRYLEQIDDALVVQAV